MIFFNPRMWTYQINFNFLLFLFSDIYSKMRLKISLVLALEINKLSRYIHIDTQQGSN